MKMPRSHCENENVKFVQELAEVDGPFESPININFRDLTKLELPSLVWNRSDACPKKMKITNTGHTVIVSGKWKCERPYLTGGPLQGKYVFSQIHFHWGQDDCKGSEHLVSGEGFPLEMHVAHFKADYLSQECALKEKDGMVVLVYLFKIQDEPNNSLKKILNCLPNIRQANSSQALDPRPILSLCHPFTDDYFMYWGSVVTSTCAHILMWLVSREPFGISKDQVCEFRKILDSAQQPICRNNRETQPLHKRNVFHVNASKNLDCAMLPIKKIFGCFCGGNEENEQTQANNCCCKGAANDQEDVQVNYVESGYPQYNSEGVYPRMNSQSFVVHQSLCVQRATVHSAPLLPKMFENTYLGQLWSSGTIRETEDTSTAKLVSQSCCFIPINDLSMMSRARPEKKRTRQKSFNSIKALSHIMESLEALKNHTCRKLKELDSINQEIKGMKLFCQEPEDRKWLKKIEKIMSRQRRFTAKSSQGCFFELKKLAKECNVDQIFENKLYSLNDSSKVFWLNQMTTEGGFSSSDISPTEVAHKIKSKSFSMDKVLKFSNKAQKLIQSFFEDIHESEDLQQSVKNDLNLRKKKNISPRQLIGTEGSGSSLNLGNRYITKKMFNMGNLEDRFFIEVKSEDLLMAEEEGWGEPNSVGNKVFVSADKNLTPNNVSFRKQNLEKTSLSSECVNQENIIPLHRADISVGLADSPKKTSGKPRHSPGYLTKRSKDSETDGENPEISFLDTYSKTESETLSRMSSSAEGKLQRESYLVQYANESFRQGERLPPKETFFDNFNPEKMLSALRNSSSNTSSSDSSGTQRMIIAKFHKKPPRKDVWGQKISKISSKGSCNNSLGKKQKIRNINFEGYYIKRKNMKSKRRKSEKGITKNELGSSCELSSISSEDLENLEKRNPNWKHMTKARFKLKIEKTSSSTIESAAEYSLVSPKMAKTQLKSRKGDDECAEDIKGSVQRLATHVTETNDLPSAQSTCLKGKDQVAATKRMKSSEKHEAVRCDSHSARTQPMSKTSSNNLKKCSSAEKVEIVQTSNNSTKRDNPVNKQLGKIKSFTNLTSRFKTCSISTEKRILDLSNDNRRRFGDDLLNLKQTLDSLKGIQGRIQCVTVKDISKNISSENYRPSILDEYKLEEVGSEDEQDDNAATYDVAFVTTPRKPCNDRHMPATLSQDGPIRTPKIVGARCDIERYHFLDKEMHEMKVVTHNESVAQPENKPSRGSLAKSASNKSLESTGPDMKGDSNLPATEPVDLPSTVSYATIKVNPQSRPHSAESFTSLRKGCKRKRKKRPHCSKRISRHYMRKNSCVFRKPNKIDGKPLHFLNLTNEEQLKIISVNVAKYLKQKLVEQKRCFQLGKENALEDVETTKDEIQRVEEVEKTALEQPLTTPIEVEKSSSFHEESIQNVETVEVEEKPEETSAHEIKDEPVKAVFGSEPTEMEFDKPEAIEKVIFEQKKVEVMMSPKEGKDPKESKDLLKKPISPRPPLNFIKLNKLMVSKYKRTGPGDMKSESQESQKKPEETKDVLVRKRSKLPRIIYQRRPNSSGGFPSPKLDETKVSKRPPKPGNPPKSPEANKATRDPEKKTSKKSPRIPRRKIKSAPGAAATIDHSSMHATKLKVKLPPGDLPPTNDQEGKSESLTNFDKCISLEKTPSSLVPAYMMTSFVTPSLEVPESQQAVNQFLMSVQKKGMNQYLPEVLYDTKNIYDAKVKKNDAIFAKDLENLIKLQMCLNNEIAANIENSMNYIKTLLNQDYNGTAIVEKAPVSDTLECFDSTQNGIVLIEMNDLIDSSSSGSEYCEDERTTNHSPSNPNEVMSKKKSEEKAKEPSKPGTIIPKEYGDIKVINPMFVPHVHAEEDCNSDSSYNCEISITLNGGTSDVQEVQSPASGFCPPEYPITCSTHLLRKESNASHLTTPLDEGHSSQWVVQKPLRKKRKDNEISMEMKKKLLEILEGEIRREMALNYQGSSENSSDALTLRWDDSNRSRSPTESSSDNTEVLAQISETMRQYLSEYKKRRLVKKNQNTLDKSKSDES